MVTSRKNFPVTYFVFGRFGVFFRKFDETRSDQTMQHGLHNIYYTPFCVNLEPNKVDDNTTLIQTSNFFRVESSAYIMLMYRARGNAWPFSSPCNLNILQHMLLYGKPSPSRSIGGQCFLKSLFVQYRHIKYSTLKTFFTDRHIRQYQL